MKKSDIKTLPEYFDRYIDLCEDIELDQAFQESLKQIDALDLEQLNRIGLRTYEKGKWTIHTILQHLTDWERIWGYRTIVAIRNTGAVPSGLDHNQMADHGNADRLSIDQLIAELRTVRLATMAMFDTFDQVMLQSNCKFSNNEMSILAMGFNIIGHQIHHFNTITERYLPLDKSIS